MSYVEKHTVTVTTATGGGATAYTPVVMGRVAAIQYIRATAADAFASTADFDIETADSAQTLWKEDAVNASKTVAPTIQAHTTTGGALATAGDVQRSPVHAATERIKITIAQGGNTKTGTFRLVIA